jgi:uncharacterized DUF497 family protein
MEFAYDPRKSASNLEKHGIDFEQAKELWLDARALIVTARSTGEERFAMVAQLEEKIWTCIFTVRNERIRIISARRARDEEKERYNQC